jgi:hypothetical protein
MQCPEPLTAAQQPSCFKAQQHWRHGGPQGAPECLSCLQEAIRENKYHYLADAQGRPAGLLGTRPTQSVTFIDNHDTGSTQAHWRFPRANKLDGYAYILTHPGVPTVFWEHLYEVRPGFSAHVCSRFA